MSNKRRGGTVSLVEEAEALEDRQKRYASAAKKGRAYEHEVSGQSRVRVLRRIDDRLRRMRGADIDELRFDES